MTLDNLLGISLEKLEPDFTSGAPFEACRFHVCRRAELPCYRCGTDTLSRAGSAAAWAIYARRVNDGRELVVIFDAIR